MIDEHLFWSLQGPSAFIREIVQKAERNGIVAVQVPLYKPDGLLRALTRALEAEALAPVHEVKNQSASSIVHRLTFAAGEYRHSLRSVGALLEAPFLRGTVFVVPTISSTEWTNWLSFFRTFTMERRRRKAEVLLPMIIALVPADCPPSDLERLFGGSVVQWMGRVSSFDMRNYVATRARKTDEESLLTRAATQLVIGLSGYDPTLAEWLCGLDPLALIDPWEKLKSAYASAEYAHPHWGNGLVDSVDGEVFIHTSSLIKANNRKEFDVRRWRAVSGPVLDFNASLCRYFADVHAAILEPRLPYRIETNMGETFIRHRYDMENRHLRDCLGDVLERHDTTFLRATNKARNNIAHNEVPEPSLLEAITNFWNGLNATVRTEHCAWNWPRCGQRLVLLIGPSGAGKSTYAQANFAPEEIVSSDAVRVELFGTFDAPGPQMKIFALVSERMTARLARGESAVVDATNLRQKDRLQLVDFIPADIRVEYIVIDRNMEEKRRDGGWRNDREGLIEAHAHLFATELRAILEGDGRTNVTVIDARAATTPAA